MADAVGRGGADADRREVHDDIREGEHRFGERFEETHHRRAFRFRKAPEREAKQNREYRDLQNLIFDDRLREIFGKHMQQEIVPVQRWRSGNRAGADCGRGSDTDTCPADIDGGETDDDRDGGDDFEVDQALQPDAANPFGIAVPGDSGDQRAQNQRRNDHRDQPQKNIAEDAQSARRRAASRNQFRRRPASRKKSNRSATIFEDRPRRSPPDPASAPARTDAPRKSAAIAPTQKDQSPASVSARSDGLRLFSSNDCRVSGPFGMAASFGATAAR